MDQLVGEGEVGEGVLINSRMEVVVVAGKGFAETMVKVEHGGDAIEAEPVELIVLGPAPAIGEQEMQDRGLAVVEASAVPGGVLAAVAFVKILIESAVETRDAIAFVFDAVRMDQVDDDGETEAMGSVDQFLEFLRGPKAAAGSEEAADMITEGAVVGVLEDAHDLHRIVAGGHDAGKDEVLELAVGADFRRLLRHADVGFVNEERPLRQVAGPGVFPDVGRHVPDLGGENEGLGILDDPLGPRRDAVPPAAGPKDVEPVVLAVGQGGKGQLQFPVPMGIEPLQRQFRELLPATEISSQENGAGMGGPLPENPAGAGAVQAIVTVTKGKFREGDAAIFGELIEQAGGFVPPAVEVWKIGRQPGVITQAGRCRRRARD